MSVFGNVTILGAGSFGTAFGQYLSNLSPTPRVTVFARDTHLARTITSTHTNPKKLPGIELNAEITATSSAADALSGTDLVVVAVPAQHVRELISGVRDCIPPTVPILNLAKGIEKSTGLRISQVIQQSLGRSNPVASLGGPSFAIDIARGNPVGVTVGCRSRSLLSQLQRFLSTPVFDVKITRDIAGVEVGGALKNVFALVAGCFEGCSLGPSVIGDYFSRSMVEMRDLGMYLGGRWSTFSGRAGLGDLAITCGEPSRNFRFGKAYARLFAEYLEIDASRKNLHEEVFLRTINELGTRTVEGFDSLEPIHAIIQRKQMFTPIISGSYRLLYKHEFVPCELLSHIRALDTHRKTEGPTVLSILIHELFPRFWYRRRVS